MMESGFQEPGDLSFFDDGIINQLQVSLALKTKLKNYIKWRDQDLPIMSEDKAFLRVTCHELIMLQRESNSTPLPGNTMRAPQDEATVDRDLKRQQIIANTRMIEVNVDRLTSKDLKSF